MLPWKPLEMGFIPLSVVASTGAQKECMLKFESFPSRKTARNVYILCQNGMNLTLTPSHKHSGTCTHKNRALMFLRLMFLCYPPRSCG
uniref:Uncharacterized protein n=1 Tax=Anguilla anguilla TaxID=7936 RepID=A0A0E9X6E6_ANGAN